LVFEYEAPLVLGAFVARPNRFVAEVNVEGTVYRAHVPDPGRLKELLIPGVPVYLVDRRHQTDAKTPFSLLLVQSPEATHWVSLNTQLPNRVVKLLFQGHHIPAFHDYDLKKAEFTHGKSRFDFLLTPQKLGKPLLVEVKSVTLVDEAKTAWFPDAPTERGARHVRELTQLKQSGDYDTAVLFVVQRGDALCVRPNPKTDPDFADALAQAQAAGVFIQAMAYTLTPQTISVTQFDLPVHV